jgi:DNA/RNA-binding domain of Phe-tRNA-synthetase-like protein
LPEAKDNQGICKAKNSGTQNVTRDGIAISQHNGVNGIMKKIIGQLNLGELIAALQRLDQNKEVRIDFAADYPGEVDSYRGYYEDLAIEFSQVKCTVGGLLQRLKNAVGEVFEGYKGGEYQMNKNTAVWVADYGSTGRAITGVRESKSMDVILLITEAIA